MLQLIIATVLMLVLFFGIGFILNMLMKTTWFPVYAYMLLIIGLVVYWAWGNGSLMSNLAEYTYVDLITGIGGLIGAVLSGSAIKTLRIRGFKMF
ncbi:hypothetical protein D3C73_625200 [compost metagenome]